MRGVDGDVMADERQAGIRLFDFLDGGVLTIDEDDGNLAALDAFLDAHDVIPAIRKHGAYMTKDTLEKALTSPDFGIRLLTELKAEREKNAAQAATSSASTSGSRNSASRQRESMSKTRAS